MKLKLKIDKGGTISMGKNGGLLRSAINASRKDEDEASALVGLQKGFTFPVKYMDENMNQGLDVDFSVSLMGITVTSATVLAEFDIHSIAFYIIDRSTNAFVFGHVDANGLMTTHQCITTQYFDIHQLVGKAISLVQKIKDATGSPLNTAEADSKAISEKLVQSGEGETLGDPTQWAGTLRKHVRVRTADAVLSSGDVIPNSGRRNSNSNSNSLQSMFDPSPTANAIETKEADVPVTDLMAQLDEASETKVSDTISKADIAKYFFEMKYRQPTREHRHAAQKVSDNPRGSSGSMGTKAISGSSLEQEPAPKTGLTSSERLSGSSRDLSRRLSKILVRRRSKTSNAVLFSVPDISTKDENAENAISSTASDEQLHEELDEFERREHGLYGTLRRFVSMPTMQKRRTSLFTYNPSGEEGSDAEGGNKEDIGARPHVLKQQDAEGNDILIKNLRKGKYEITAGTLPALVNALVDPHTDDSYVETFLLTYRHCMEPIDLLNMIFEGWKKEDDPSKLPSERLPLHKRCIKVIELWVKSFSDDFSTAETMLALNQYLDYLHNAELCAGEAAQIRGILRYEERRLHGESVISPESPNLVITTYLPMSSGVLEFDVTAYPARKFAQHITLADLRLFKAVTQHECVKFLWGSKADQPKLHHLNAWVQRFNRIGYWVATTVVMTKDGQKRVASLDKLIKIAKHCSRIHNYNALMAIISGLNMSPVQRLKKTWGDISPKLMETLTVLEETMSYKSNFKTYRELEFAAKPPIVPFFGLFMKDLTFSNDGNQRVLHSGLINFEKQRLIANQIRGMSNYQRDTSLYPERFASSDAHHYSAADIMGSTDTTAILTRYCRSLPSLDDDSALLAASKEIE